jgi:hypothetical protein
MTKRFGIAVVLALLVAAPAVAAPALDGAHPRRSLESELPTDRPIVATVVEIDGDAGTVILSTPHGDVELSISRDLASRLTIGDVVVVRFTDAEDDDSPSASPRDVPPSSGSLKI